MTEGKTLEELAQDRQSYLQRALQLSDEIDRIEQKLPELRDELMQIRGALAYVEMTMEELTKKQASQENQPETPPETEPETPPETEPETPE